MKLAYASLDINNNSYLLYRVIFIIDETLKKKEGSS